MRKRRRHFQKVTSGHQPELSAPAVLPPLATADQLAAVLQVTPRTIHYWASAGTIPTALRQGKIVRFSPSDVAAALGINLPEFGISAEPATATLVG